MFNYTAVCIIVEVLNDHLESVCANNIMYSKQAGRKALTGRGCGHMTHSVHST